MPKVGKKHFSYSKAGRKAAKAYGRKLAQEMEEAHDPTDAQIKQAAADEKKAGKKKPSPDDLAFAKKIKKQMGPKTRGTGIEVFRKRIRQAGKRGKAAQTRSMEREDEGAALRKTARAGLLAAPYAIKGTENVAKAGTRIIGKTVGAVAGEVGRFGTAVGTRTRDAYRAGRGRLLRKMADKAESLKNGDKAKLRIVRKNGENGKNGINGNNGDREDSSMNYYDRLLRLVVEDTPVGSIAKK